MAVEMKPGARWKSAVSDTEIVVVRGAADAVDLRCGGHPMVPSDEDRPAGLMPADPGATTLLGKRYVDETSGVEVLCIKGGQGALSVADAPLGLKDAKPLPSSD